MSLRVASLQNAVRTPQCVIKVAFKPTTEGAKVASLNVNGGGGGLRSVNLTVTGVL